MRWWNLAVAFLPVLAAQDRQPQPPRLQCQVTTGVRIGVGADSIQSPAEGLWSIATGWKDGQPVDWVHARPSRVQQEGPWTLVCGEMPLSGGVMELRDAYRVVGAHVQVVRRFAWKGAQPLSRCTLSIRWHLPGATHGLPTLPGIVTYGNPAGAATGRDTVIHHAGKPGDTTLCEEHRFAAPWVSLEWPSQGGWRAAALHTWPSRAPGGHQSDQWWSLGLLSKTDGTELAAFTGPTSANGRPNVAKALQDKFLTLPDAWIELAPGAVVEKRFFIDPPRATERGQGFRTALQTARELHPLGATEDLPLAADIVREKLRFARSRFRDRAEDPGFEMFPERVKGTHYVMGWCGQAESASYAFVTQKDPELVAMGRRSLDHLCKAPFNEHGFLLQYNPETRSWKDQDPVSQGQAMEGFARAILAGRRLRGVDTRPWEAFLKRACELHAERILKPDWKPVNTAEAFFISPLCKASNLFANPRLQKAALKAGEYYAARHGTMAEPYWGGTLDASCEDKEGAFAAFQGFLAIFELTRDPRFLERAAHAMDVVLTYTVLWDIDLPAGRLRDHGLKTRGWTIVSAQNQHLDVFGVLYTPELWRMGTYLKRPDLQRLAAVMFRSCGQLLDPLGSQGEQIQQTNFGQQGDLSDVLRLRGGYSENWTVFWITAHFLNAAAEFQRMGVDLDRAP